MKTLKKGILRVGIMNNFNFTAEEFKALEQFDKDWLVFVNSCSFQKLSGKYPVVVTLNPYIDKFIAPRGDLSLIKAVRIKHVVDAKENVLAAEKQSITWAKKRNIPILVTFMRFKNRRQLLTYTKSELNYKYKKAYFRPTQIKLADSSLYYCDFEKKGCPECRNCAKLVFGVDTDAIYGINLSASGICAYNCPSCFAGYMVRFLGKNMIFDKVTQNRKQRGVL